LLSVDACTTRLRLTVHDLGAVDDRTLAMLGAKGIVRPAPHALQVVLGPEADRVADQMRAVLAAPPSSVTVEAAPPETAATAAATAAAAGATAATAAVAATVVDRAAWLAALGGAHNLKTIEALAATRLRCELHDGATIDEVALRRLGAHGVMRLSDRVVHVLAGASAPAIAAALRSPVIVVVRSPSAAGGSPDRPV
jgi:PTS system N-acetylglucosamine-specific IIC component